MTPPTKTPSTADGDRIVGTGVARHDGLDKVLGRAVYGVDAELPGMLVGKILRSPLPHARIRHIDTERARRLPGVRAVITGADTPGVRYGFFKHYDPRYADKLPLETDKVRFVGDEVAAVAAVDEDTAREALSLIDVDYEELPAVFDVDTAIAPGAPLVHDGVANNIATIIRRGAGDMEQALRDADLVIERPYSTHAVTPCCLEPHQALASYDSAAGTVTLWSSTQAPFQLREHLADVLGLAEAKVRVVKTVMGAGFGAKMEMHALEPVASLLSLRTRRPVRIIYSRTEVFQATRFRHPFKMTCRIALRRDGRILGLETKALVESGAYVSQAPGVVSVAGTNPFSIYSVPSFRYEGTIVYTNKPYGGAYRGYGNPQVTFGLESLVDEAASELGIEPVELRRRNLHRQGDVTSLGYRLASCAQGETLEAVVNAIRPHEPRPRGRGVGFAGLFGPGGGVRVHGDSDGCGVIMKMEDDGTLQVITGGQEIGQGGTTIVAQIAAETVGVPYASIRVESSDTNLIPWDLGTHGSRNTFVTGNAVEGAGRKLLSRVLAIAAELLEANAGDLVSAQGKVSVRGTPDRFVTMAQVAKAAHYRNQGAQLMVEHFYDPPTELPNHSTGKGNKSGAYSFGFHGVEVDVDEETGEVRVLRVVAAHDVGRAINPKGVEGQVEGGVAQGIGFTLMEDMFADDGQTLIANLEGYKMPVALDVPTKIETILVESVDPGGPYGAKGVAEPAIIPVAPAILNAIENAIGVRVRDLPATPEKILNALAARKAQA